MLHTSLRIIHSTDRYTVTRFRAAAGHVTADTFVLERLSQGTTVGVVALSDRAADAFSQAWHDAIAASVNTRPIAKPFEVDRLLSTFFFSGDRDAAR